MDLAKESYRLARRACAAVLILSSCAHRPPSGRTESTVLPSPAAITATAQGSPKSRVAAAAPIERRTTLQALPKKEPTKAEQIITLVREGYLVDEAKGALVFWKTKPTGALGSGLYEDAILLGRLRRTLKETDGIPDSLSATATVRDAKAFLKIDDTLPAPTAARAIDAALRTPGVNAVQARIAG